VNLRLQRWVDRRVGAPLCRLLSLWPSPPTAMPQRPRAILVILLSEMGSLVLAQPMFRHLRERWPEARLHALVFEKNREMLDLLEVVAPEDVLTISDASAGAFARDAAAALLRLRRLRPDAVIDCELFARISSLLSRLSGARMRAGFHPHTQEGLYRGGFINRPVLYNPYLHISHQYLNLAKALEAHSRPLPKRAVDGDRLTVPPKAFDAAETRAYGEALVRDFPLLKGRRLVLVYPGGGILPIRAWPREHYLALCRALLEDGLAVGFIGLKSDRELAQGLVRECATSRCVDMTGYTRSIRELLLLFGHAALLVTNDGGPGQFAALSEIPNIVFFGPETPQLYGTLSPHSRAFFAGLSCSPCLSAYNHRDSPCDGDNRCLQGIPVDAVLAAAREMLGERS
jgi:ADP-heptose:LPS heptosyltransferase